MQSIEAVISLVVFLSIISFLLISSGEPRNIDDSLYRIQLAEDAWRVLYLRGDLQGLNGSAESRARLENDMGTITDETALCVFMGGVEFTSCRGDGISGSAGYEITASITRTAIYDGKPRRFQFSLAK
ncbi:hypothetical protein H0O00_04680 [Candidatus Micrarchaeota archaeon]|nr:hypothetical protein [Candidatus Micrarchaeota archaeon]